MKRRWGTSSEPSGSTLSPPELSHNHTQFLQVAAQQHLARLRTVATSTDTPIQSPDAASNSNSIDRNSNTNANINTNRNKATTLPNKCIILGPGPAPVRRINDSESKNSRKQPQQQQQQQQEDLPVNGRRKRRVPPVKTNNKQRGTRRKKRPRIPPPDSHPEQDLFYYVNFTSCQIGSRLLCPPPPTNKPPSMSLVEVLTNEDSLILQKYREMQHRFNTGFDLSTLATLHQQLQTNYSQATKILLQSTNPASNSTTRTRTTGTTTNSTKNKSTPTDGSHNDALRLRNELAGLWILYAHVLLEIGLRLCQQQYHHQQQQQQRQRQRQTLQREQQQSQHDQGINLTSHTNHHHQQQQEQQQQQPQLTFLASSTNSPAQQNQHSLEQKEQQKHPEKSVTTREQSPARREELQQEQQQRPEKSVTARAQTPARKKKGRSRPPSDDAQTQPEFSVDDVLKCVSAVLQAAGQCPMVGNHKYIALSLGRLVVVETVLGASARNIPTVATRIRMKSQLLSDSITNAIAACHQTLELCHGITLNNRHKGPKLQHHPAVVDSIQKFCHCLSHSPSAPDIDIGTDDTWLTTIAIKQDMLSILALPDQLIRKANLSTRLMKDSHTARIICHEINRWCRLREKLQKRAYTLISPCLDYRSNSLQSVMATQLMDQFLFYRTMDCPADIRVPGAKWTDLEYPPPPAENVGMVQWNW